MSGDDPISTPSVTWYPTSRRRVGYACYTRCWDRVIFTHIECSDFILLRFHLVVHLAKLVCLAPFLLSYSCKWAQMVIPPSKTQVLSMLSNEWYTVIFVSYFLSFYINQYSYSTFLIPKYFYTCLHCKKQTRGGNSSSDFDSRSRCQIINVFVVIFRVIVLLRTCKYCVSPFSLLRSFLCILFISVSIVTVNILYFITFRRANCWFASCHFVSMRAPVVRIRVADWSSARRKRKT